MLTFNLNVSLGSTAFLNEDYINWNGKAGNVGISGRNYPTGYELVELINQSITKMLGNSIAE